jgi:hypothetical protein
MRVLPPSADLSIRHRALAALLLTVFQVALTFWVAQEFRVPVAGKFAERGFPPPNAYERICVADCLWFANIARQGYHSSIPPAHIQEGESNVAFFPAFPLLVRATHSILPVSSWPAASLLGSQIATAVFWLVLLLFLDRWAVPPKVAAFVVFAILSHPSSLFMVAGHSESLYMAGIAGLLWCGETAPAWGAIPGAILTATRLLGFPFLLYPALRGVRPRASQRFGWIMMAAGLCLGVGAFFLYCHMRFGVWDLYLQTQHLGWGHVADYWFFLRSASYRTSLPFRLPVLASAVVLPIMALMECRIGAKDTDRERVWTRRALLLTAVAEFYLTGAGGARTDRVSTPFVAFTRYTLPIGLLLVLVLADQLRVLKPSPRAMRIAAWSVGFVCLGSLIFLNVLRETVTHLRG